MSITIRDLARRLNLSITTVSRALDGYTDVAESTRERVTRAAAEVGYTPNRAARQLRRQRTDTIGYILPARQPRFSDPFFSDFMAGLGDAASDLNYDLLVSTAAPGEASERDLYARWMNGRKVDGFVLNRMRLQDWRVQFLSANRVPFVSLGKSQDGVSYPCVTVNDRHASFNLARHLIAGGRRRLAFIGASPDLVIATERLGGFKDALAEASLPVDPALIIPCELARQDGLLAARRLLELDRPPDGIVCANDLLAIGAMAAAAERGLRVGVDLALAGFDNIEESAHAQPPLTTLSQPVYEIGLMLVKMLVDVLNDPSAPVSSVNLDPELVIRASTTG